MNLTALQATLRQFAADRQWQPFQTPKNLAMAMIVEAAELAEIFQWMTPEQSVAAHQDAAVKQHIGEEIADVLLYLLQVADHTHTDIGQAVQAKLAINARKYPPKHPPKHPPTHPRQAKAPGRAAQAAQAAQAAEVSQAAPALAAAVPAAEAVAAPALRAAPLSQLAGAAGQTHVLLDFENVQPTAEQLRALVPGLDHVWLFHGPHQKDPGRRLAGLPVTLVPISKTGKNALDFHLTFYVGYIASRYPGAPIVVVANDRGYEPMLMHARTLGFDVRLQTHAPAAKKVVPARKVAAAKKAAPVPTAAPVAAGVKLAKPQGARPAKQARQVRPATEVTQPTQAKPAKQAKHADRPKRATQVQPALASLQPAAVPPSPVPPAPAHRAPTTEATARQQAVRNLAVKVAAKRPGALAAAPVAAAPVAAAPIRPAAKGRASSRRG